MARTTASAATSSSALGDATFDARHAGVRQRHRGVSAVACVRASFRSSYTSTMRDDDDDVDDDDVDDDDEDNHHHGCCRNAHGCGK